MMKTLFNRMDYSDIIDLPHYNPKYHVRMPMSKRIEQILPFATLSKYYEEVDETKRVTESLVHLTDDKLEKINHSILLLAKYNTIEATFTWFEPDSKKTGGTYHHVTSSLEEIDTTAGLITTTDGTMIPMNYLTDIEFT